MVKKKGDAEGDFNYIWMKLLQQKKRRDSAVLPEVEIITRALFRKWWRPKTELKERT